MAATAALGVSLLAGALFTATPALAATQSGTYTKPDTAAYLPQATTYLEIFNTDPADDPNGNVYTQLYTAEFTPDGQQFVRKAAGDRSGANYNALAFDNRTGEGKLYVVVFRGSEDSLGEGEIATVDVNTGEITRTGKKISLHYTDPDGIGATDAAPISAAMGDDGIIYYTAAYSTEYATFNVDTGEVSFHKFADDASTLVSDWTFLDGYLWGRDNKQGDLVRVDPATGAISQFPVPEGMVNDHAFEGGAANATGAMFTFANGNLGFQLNSGQLQQVKVTNSGSDNPTFTVVGTYIGHAGSGTDGAVAYATELPDLAIEKTATPKSVTVGDTVTWTLTVTNNGPGNSSGYIVTDPVPAEFSDVASDDPSVTVDGNNITIQGGALAAGESRSYTFTSTTTEVGTFDNVATVDGNEPENEDHTEDNTDDDDVTTTPVPVPGWTVQKTDDVAATVFPGDVVNYSVTATNTGDTVITDALVTDDLSDVVDNATIKPESLASSKGDAPAVSEDGTTLSWTGDLEVGETVTLTYSVVVNDDATSADEINNAVVGTSPEVPSNCVEGTEDGCFTEHGVLVPGLDVNKTDGTEGDVAPGEKIDYTVVGENTGEVDLTGVVITDDLSDVLDDATIDESSIAASFGDNAVYDADAKTLTWTGDLAVGEKVELTYSVVVNDDAADGSAVLNGVVGTSNEVLSDCVAGTEESCFTEHEVEVPETPVAPEKPEADKPSNLARTGGDIAPWLIGGSALLVLAGGATIALTRRRQVVPAAEPSEQD